MKATARARSRANLCEQSTAPQPEGPRSATNSSDSTARLTSPSASTAWPRRSTYVFETRSMTTRTANPTSAVRGGQGRSFGHLEKKSPLHFGGSGDRRRHAQALREVEAEPVEEGSLA